MQSFDVVTAFVSNAEPINRRLAQAPLQLGPALAAKIIMLNLSAANLIGGFVFGSIGFVAFVYGKRMNLWKPMFLGIALMVYPYFVSNDAAMIAMARSEQRVCSFCDRRAARRFVISGLMANEPEQIILGDHAIPPIERSARRRWFGRG